MSGAETSMGSAQDARLVREDVMVPFRLERANLRGRAARLGPTIDAILSRHDYPAPVAGLLGEALALTAVLAGTLKYDGIFTLQAKGDGPIKLLVCDVTSDGDLRGFADVDQDKFSALGDASPDGPVPRLLGAGYLAFTVDQGADMDRYQGIVELTGATLTECAQHYFRQSEQIDTLLRLGVGRPDGEHWSASALMIQRVPMMGGSSDDAGNEDAGHIDEEQREDDWRRLAIVLGTVRNEEALADDADPARLLYRLFHEDGVRVFEPQTLRDQCRCSDERAENALRMLSDEELEDMKVDGEITVSCQFCSRLRRYDEAALAGLRIGEADG